jgi:hypothetical protein
MGNDAIDTGWFFDEPCDLSKAFAVAGGGGELGERVRAWAQRNRVTRTEYVTRSLAAKTPYHDIFVPAPSIDTAVELLTAYDLPKPNVLADDALRRGAAKGAGASIRMTAKGVTRVGVLARRPSTDSVLSLIRTQDERDAKLLAAFEGALGVTGAEWAQYEVHAGNRTDVELHYALG